jgi:putative colanic acid biosynthesis acetyltransferase WcaF
MMWRALWMFLGLPLFQSTWLAFSGIRVSLLRGFGARVGDRVVIRQNVIVKYPWNLTVGDDCWIGEEAWIDNLVMVSLGSNVCISQGAYLCTGNHNWSDPRFGLRVAPITLCDGSWAGAKSILLPGVTLHEGAIAAAGSVVTTSIAEDVIAMGNPAKATKRREYRHTSSDLSQQPNEFMQLTGLQEDAR